MKKMILILFFIYPLIAGAHNIYKTIPLPSEVSSISASYESNRIYALSENKTLYAYSSSFEKLAEIKLDTLPQKVLSSENRVVVVFSDKIYIFTPDLLNKSIFSIKNIVNTALYKNNLLVSTKQKLFLINLANMQKTEMLNEAATLEAFDVYSNPIYCSGDTIYYLSQKIAVPLSIERPLVSIDADNDYLYASSYSKLYRYKIKERYWDNVFSYNTPGNAQLITKIGSNGNFLFCMTYNNFFIYNKKLESWKAIDALQNKKLLSFVLYKNYIILGTADGIIVYNNDNPTFYIKNEDERNSILNFKLGIESSNKIKNASLSYKNISMNGPEIPIPSFKLGQDNSLSFSFDYSNLYNGTYIINIAVSDIYSNSNDLNIYKKIVSLSRALSLNDYAEKEKNSGLFQISGRVLNQFVNRVIFYPGKQPGIIDTPTMNIHATLPLEYGQNKVCAHAYAGDQLISVETSSINAKETNKTLNITGVIATYLIKKGDTLWNIATKFYGNGTYYPLIAAYNNIDKKNYKKLKINTALKIPKI